VPRLDRIPLAIELAAPWVRLFTPAELLPQLTGRLDLLIAARRDLPPRQRSMRATVEWSHQLLSGPQRVLFRRLAVFAGSFGRDAAERVCGSPPLSPGEIAALLTRLAGQSMLIVERHSAISRYRLLETLRDFAREHLDRTGEYSQLRRRHAAHYLARAERIDGHRLRTGSDAEIAALVPDPTTTGRPWPGVRSTIRKARCGWRRRWRASG
jgi:predicted ATPase